MSAPIEIVKGEIIRLDMEKGYYWRRGKYFEMLNDCRVALAERASAEPWARRSQRLARAEGRRTEKARRDAPPNRGHVRKVDRPRCSAFTPGET